MPSTELKELEKRAEKRAAAMGGLLAILLSLRLRKLSDVTFDRSRAQFKIGGKVVTVNQLRNELKRIDLKLAAQIKVYADQVASGQITVDEWKQKMLELMEDGHLLYTSLALGSIAIASAAPIFIRRADRDLKYLNGFAADVKANRLPTAISIFNRGKKYLRSLDITYQQSDHQAHIAAGFTEARRILNALESCSHYTDPLGCIQVANKGWILIKQMPPIGTLFCGQYCRCYLEYR